MSLFIRKTAVLISLICYLLVSSIAAGHAYTIFADDVGDNVEMVVSMGDIEMPDCHKSAGPTPNQSDSATCKIFCSVLAQAMSESDDQVINLDVVPSIKITPYQTKVLTRLVAVEPHPPK